MVIVDVQRGGPSTGLPTKTEQADLLLAMYGRHGEAPLPIVAAQSPADCFDAAFEAVRLALKYRTPVILLTDGYLANGAEPWILPDLDALPDISVPFATELNHGDEFWPYLRDPETLARPWAIPGTPKLMHRIGGIEKEDGTGNISYDAENHDAMTRHPRREDRRHRERHPARRPRRRGRRRVPGAQSGAARGARRRRRSAASAAAGRKIAHAHLRHMNPFPRRPRRRRAPVPEDPRARDQPRPALEADSRRVPRRRAELREDVRRAVPRRRARRARSWR